MKDEPISDGFYYPDLGPECPVPEDFVVTMKNMKEGCVLADKYAEELEWAALSMPTDEWITK